MRKALAFLKRDFQQEITYRLSFLLQVCGILLTLTTFYFISGLVEPAASPYLVKYGGDYFGFVIVGLAFYQYLGTALGSFASAMRSGQVTGTLEAIFCTPTSPYVIVICSGLFSFAYTAVELAMYIGFGAAFFGFDVSRVNVPAFLAVLALTVASFSAFGVASAGFILVFKRGDPIAFVISSLSGLFGGVFFPVDMLPGWLAFVPKLLPMTYALEAFRACITKGSGVSELGAEIGALALFTAVALPLSLVLFRLAIARARQTGGLATY